MIVISKSLSLYVTDEYYANMWTLAYNILRLEMTLELDKKYGNIVTDWDIPGSYVSAYCSAPRGRNCRTQLTCDLHLPFDIVREIMESYRIRMETMRDE